MIARRLEREVKARLEETPAVALLGPRQVGKTTLAHAVASGRPSVYLDLESERDRAKLIDTEWYLEQVADRLVILDEVHRMPEIFKSLRGIIDRGRRGGKNSGRFLLLGSASMDLMKQTGESLAGRISYLELAPIDVTEVDDRDETRLWIRGGFPNSFLASSDERSMRWRLDFIKTYLERDIPQLGPRIPSETLRRFWTMLAHLQGGIANLAQVAGALGVTGKTAATYLELMVDLLLVRRLPPWHGNVGKRLIKSPKIYVRDSGLVHALLGLDGEEAVLGHPVAGTSWEGFVLESLIGAMPERTTPSYYRNSAGAEVDLILDLPGGSRWVVEVKRGVNPRPERGFYSACDDLEPDRAFVVYPGAERYRLGAGVEAIGLREMSAQFALRSS